MLRDLQIWIEIIFPINSSTVRRRCCSKRIAQRIRDRRRLLVSFVFLSRVCSKLYLPPTSRNSIVVQLRIDDAKEIRVEGEELIKRGVFGQFDTFFLSPPRWWGRYSSLLHEDMDIPAPFLFYEGRKKILMKRGIGDPFETKALSGRTTSLLPPSLRCVSE